MFKDVMSSAIVCLLDSAVKYEAEKRLCNGSEKYLFKGRVKLKLHHNHGAMLNFNGRDPRAVKIMSCGLTGALISSYILNVISGKGSGRLKALSLIIGGAASNTLDRVNKGFVTDYVSFPFIGDRLSRVLGKRAGKYIGGIVFNISDFFIIGGTLFLMIREISEVEA